MDLQRMMDRARALAARARRPTARAAGDPCGCAGSAPLEALAAAAAYATFPDLLAGSLVLHFIDNQGTLAHVVSGSARDRDCSRIAHACSAATLRLRCRVWYEYVASAANISDLPTRDEFAMLRRLGSTARALVLPRLPLF